MNRRVSAAAVERFNARPEVFDFVAREPGVFGPLFSTSERHLAEIVWNIAEAELVLRQAHQVVEPAH